MNYSLDRIWSMTTSYIRRNILYKNGECEKTFTLIDLTNSYIDRIDNDTPEENIVSILWNDFYEKKNISYGTVEFFKQNQNTLITDHKVPVSNFSIWFGVKDGKIIADKLENLPNDLIVFPARNWKRSYGKIVDVKYVDDINVNNLYQNTIYFIDEFGNNIYYPSAGPVVKILMIGKKHQLFLSCNPCFYSEKYVEELKKYIIDNPCYLILLDNGRYNHFFTEGKYKKQLYISSGPIEYNEMHVFGEVNYSNTCSS